MSSVEKMLYCTVSGSLDELDTVLRHINDSGCFHIEPVNGSVTALDGNGENPYAGVLRKLHEISVLTGHKLTPTVFDEALAPGIPAGTEEILQRARECSEELKVVEEKLISDTIILEQLSHTVGTGDNAVSVDVKQVFTIDDAGNIKIRFGRMPVNSAEKLDYYADRGMYFLEYGGGKDFVYGFVFIPYDRCAEIDRILGTLYFERILIPDFLSGDIRTAAAELSKKVDAEKAEAAEKKKLLERIGTDNSERIDTYFTCFKTLHDIHGLRSFAAVENERFIIKGFIPAAEKDRFSALFTDTASAMIDTQDADGEKQKVPVKLKCSKFSEPFTMFVDLYGLPGYKDLNPTTFFAITYTLLFGIMFGDLGQGFLVALAGFFLGHKKNMKLGRIMERLGISSMIFGTLYGSVFGFEELLDPVYESLGIHFLPFGAIKNINTVLYGAIAIGIVIIMISILTNIVMGFIHKDYGRAVFSNNGIAGLVFYGALLFMLVGGMIGIKAGGTAYVLLLIVLPLVLMFLQEPLSELCRGEGFHIKGKVGDFIASSFFECFEYVLGFATNTLSFVRVGGFVLSHAGMMSVVMALSAMAGTGSPIVIILGNLFVMALEGLLVGIQVLRLEYYEMFSRYYTGGGIAFKPVSVNFTEVIE